MALTGLLLLLFTAGIATLGIAHQTAWLLSSPVPAVQDRYRARKAGDNQLFQLGFAAKQYHDKATHFPGALPGPRGQLFHGWQTALLPYLLDDDAPTAARAIHLDLPWDHPDNRPALQTVLRGYQHPAIPAKVNAAGYALSHYAANARVLGGTRPMSRGEILDGPVNTILIGEINEHFKPWGHPANWRDPALGLKGHPHGFGSPTGPDVRFLMSDGSVRVLKQDTDPKVLRALSTPNGGEPINAAELP